MGGAYIAIHNHETRKEMQTNIITADALPLYKKELITEIINAVKGAFLKGVYPWLKEYKGCLKIEKHTPSISMSSRRMEAQTKYQRMLALSVELLKSRWLTTYAVRCNAANISQSDYEKLVDAQIAQLVKEAGL